MDDIAKQAAPEVQMDLGVLTAPEVQTGLEVLMVPEVSRAGTSRVSRMSAARTNSIGDVAREPSAVTGMKRAFLTMTAPISTTNAPLQVSEVAAIDL